MIEDVYDLFCQVTDLTEYLSELNDVVPEQIIPINKHPSIKRDIEISFKSMQDSMLSIQKQIDHCFYLLEILND